MPEGNYAAYSQQYAKGPVDVAGKTATAVDEFAKTRKLEQETYDLEQKQTKENNTKLYGDKIANLIDTQEAPPNAQEISIQAGDEIYKLIKEGGLEGIELNRAIDRIVSDSNNAVQGIVKAADAKNKAPKDLFYTDGKFGASNDQMLKGNFAFEYKDGRGQWVGADEKGNPVEYSVKEYNQMRGKTIDVPQVSTAKALEVLTKKKTALGWNLNTIEGNQAFKASAVSAAASNLNATNGAATARFIYNNTDLGTDKEAYLAMGQKLTNGAKYEDLDATEKSLFDKHIKAGRQVFSGSLTKDLQQPKPRTGSGTVDKNKFKLDKTGVKDINAILDDNDVSGIKAAIDEIIKTDGGDEDAVANVVRQLYPEATVSIDYAGNDATHLVGLGSTNRGTITIKTPDGEKEYDFDNDVEGQTLSDVVIKDRKGDYSDLIDKYSDLTNLVDLNNAGTTANQFSSYYRKEGFSFEPSGTGLKVTKGSRSQTISFEDKTEEEVKIAMEVIAETL